MNVYVGTHISAPWMIVGACACARACALMWIETWTGVVCGRSAGSPTALLCGTLSACAQVGAGLFALVSPLAMYLVAQGGAGHVIFGQLLLVFAMAIYSAPLCVFMLPLFPVDLRYSGVGIAWNLGHMVFGGSAPLLATALHHSTHNAVLVGLYMSAVATLAFSVVFYGGAHSFSYTGACLCSRMLVDSHSRTYTDPSTFTC